MSQKSEEAFKLKANFLPITVIKFFCCEQSSVLNQLKEMQAAAPNYFNQSPVIIDLTPLKRPVQGLDLDNLSQCLRKYQLIPVGIQGLYPEEESSAQALGLALWRAGSGIESKNQTESVIQPDSSASTELDRPLKRMNTVVTKPVRSGMRVYAKQSNLVLLAPVSSGAECIADGDIFCYAPVRGRMLAGAGGDLQAQIFCQCLEAELLSIAGYYLLYDECPIERTGNFQIFLKESKIYIRSFG